MNTEQKYDVVAVNHGTNKVRILESGKDRENAEAIVSMAVMRRGLDDEFFAEVPTGAFKNDDEYRAVELPPKPKKEPSSIHRIGNMWYPSGPRGL